MATLPKCDCLNDCGDDPRVRLGQAQKCVNFERLHKHDPMHVDAQRLRQLAEMPDFEFLVELRKNYKGNQKDFYRAMIEAIDKQARKGVQR